MSATYPIIEFHQYDSDDDDDRLLLFAAPATALLSWAGIPRKGWQVRILYQRWITDSRKQEVIAFWNQAGTRRESQAKKFLVGPTALTVALFGSPTLNADGELLLEYEPPFDLADSDADKLSKSAAVVLQRMQGRLDTFEREVLGRVQEDPYAELPATDTNYVLESLCQIAQMSIDPDFFISENALTDDDTAQLTQSLEALARPALVVDGQHRLYGAANSEHDVWLPVVAMPNSPWMEQIYQFVVINEKAQRVESSLLTDIFGSSLTPQEQAEIRLQLDRSGVMVEQRIAAVIAARDEQSPFVDLVRIRLDGQPPSGVDSFIPESTIRQLIDGGRGSRGWRSDNEFYQVYIEPTIPNRVEWDSWTEGAWRGYWFAFWMEVRDFYNEKASSDDLWSSKGQTNLTKAVTLRLFQKLFIEQAVARVQDVLRTRETLVAVLGEEEADTRLAAQIRDKAIPSDISEFRAQVREWFLRNGVPVRVFEKPWVSSLDDAQGQQYLFDEFEQAFNKSQKGDRYLARNNAVFAVEDS